MSFISDFENRIEDVFGSGRGGYTLPFSFKKLAKEAAREMERETFEMNGVETAPALYTVLVSEADDALMQPLYKNITFEIASFVRAQARRKGYGMIGAPLVRFMVDPTLRSGKFAVFAENVDGRTLAELSKEESRFYEEIARGNKNGTKAPAHGAHSAVAGAHSAQSSRGAGAKAAPSAQAGGASLAGAHSAASGRDTFLDPDDDFWGNQNYQSPRNAENAPRTVLRKNRPAAAPDGPDNPAGMSSCTLTNTETGRIFGLTGPSALIGRDRGQADVALSDPNVSRRHAELTYHAGRWYIEDLNSTNGTYVNDNPVDSTLLRDGDIITIGLVNLEFERGSL